MAKQLSKMKFHQAIHAKTYNDINSNPQKKYSLGTVSENFIVRLKSVLRGHNPRP